MNSPEHSETPCERCRHRNDKSREYRAAATKRRPIFSVDAWEPTLLARMEKASRGEYRKS